MPAVVRGRPAEQRIVVPRRLGLALEPEIDRAPIPSRVTLSTNAPPFAGEVREEQSNTKPLTIPSGVTATVATLRRPWNFVGWAVNPGNTIGVGLVAALRILTRAVNVPTATTAIPAGVGLAVINQIVGAPCELIVHNGTNSTITGLRGVIWGMGER